MIYLKKKEKACYWCRITTHHVNEKHKSRSWNFFVALGVNNEWKGGDDEEDDHERKGEREREG